MERCPACRSRLGGEPLCPRCQCDLSLPLRAERQAQGFTSAAVRALACGQPDQAVIHARRALSLKRDALPRAILAWARKSAAFIPSKAEAGILELVSPDVIVNGNAVGFGSPDPIATVPLAAPFPAEEALESATLIVDGPEVVPRPDEADVEMKIPRSNTIVDLAVTFAAGEEPVKAEMPEVLDAPDPRLQPPNAELDDAAVPARPVRWLRHWFHRSQPPSSPKG